MSNSNWEVTTLGKHLSPRKRKGIPSQSPGLPYLGLEHVEGHTGRILNLGSSKDFKSSSPFVESGDVLYGRLRPYLNKVVIAPERLYVSGEFIVFPESETLDSKFLQYLLMSPDFLAFTALLDTGDRPRVSWDKIANFEFRIPVLEEQKRIVEVLDDHLSRLDKALDETAVATNKAKTYWYAMLQSLLFHDEQGVIAQTVPLGSLAELVMGQAPAGSECNKDGVGTPFVKVGEFGSLIPEVREWTTKPLKMAHATDVLICVVGATIGKLNFGIDCAIGRSVAAIRAGSNLRQKYLYYYLQSKVLEIRASSKGSAQGVITRQQLLEMPIPNLSLQAQDEIVEALETSRISLDQALFDLRKTSLSTDTLRRALLNSAFTGGMLSKRNEFQ